MALVVFVSVCCVPFFFCWSSNPDFAFHYGLNSIIFLLVHSAAYFSDGIGTAFLRKERLLRFDRDFARRTQILDDQADYQAPSTWMTEEEKMEAEEKQQKHLESLKRPKQVLNLAI